MTWFEHGSSRIYYEDAGGAGDPVLLLPGFAGSIEEFTALRAALSAAGYRVIAADLPGSGRSLPQPRAYPITYYEDDARSFAALLAHLGVHSAHLLGFSDGGEVELLMAVFNPEIVRSVVTWGAAGALADPNGNLFDVLYNIVDHPAPGMQLLSDYLIAAYGSDIALARATTQVVAKTWHDIVAAGGSISFDRARAIACPTLLIVGEHDTGVPATLVAALAARILHAEMLTVADAGHAVHYSHPDWLARTILDWLKRTVTKAE